MTTWVLGLEDGPLDPEETVAYEFDFSPFLQSGEAVASAQAASGDLTVVSSNFTGNILTAYLTGGMIGEKAEVEFECLGDDGTEPSEIKRSVFFWIAPL